MLCLWLPFTDGTTKNQGLIQDGITTGVTPTFINDGKLGKCLNQGQIDIDADTTAKILNNQELTICFWLYVNAEEGSTTKRGMLFGNSGTGVNDNRKFSLFQYPTCNDLHLSWMNDTANTMFLSAIWQAVLPSYKWTHVAVTYSNPDATIYINGQIYAKHTGISNSTSFAYNTRVVWNNAYRYLNDFRIYNTCLSPRQIKEISKGLICHYSLGEIDGKIGGRNILRNSKNLASLSLKDTLAKVERTDTNCKLSLASGVASNSWYAIYTDFTIEKNQSYTASIEIETVNLVSGSKGCHFTAAKIPPNSSWNDFAKVDFKTSGKYHYTFNSGNNTSVRIALGVQGDGSSNYVIAKNLKLEKGISATSWTPAPEDDASFYDNVIYDTSGYCNNGSVTDSTCPTWSSDTPRYKGSYVFNGNNQYLKFQNPITSSSTDFTISCWVKFDDTTGSSTICTMRTAVGNGIALFKIGNKIRFDDNAQFTFSDYTISANEWTHVVVTRSSSYKNLYINGVLKQTINTVGDMKLISNVGTIGASSQSGDGISNYLNGQLSDFRIYATALDNQTIEELYKVGASVNNNGNLSTYEIEEEL